MKIQLVTDLLRVSTVELVMLYSVRVEIEPIGRPKLVTSAHPPHLTSQLRALVSNATKLQPYHYTVTADSIRAYTFTPAITILLTFHTRFFTFYNIHLRIIVIFVYCYSSITMDRQQAVG